MEEIRLGTIGSGFIVHNILRHASKTPGICLEAVYSRNDDTGAALAGQYGFAKVYTDLERFMADPQIQCIYVASPNSLHYLHTKAALLAGKHVICEKPFCPTARQARELADLAAEKGLMLVDATPTICLPNLQFLHKHLPRIGPIRLVMGNYSQYSSRFDSLLQGKVTNVFDPNFAGGCLMDINYYNLYLNVLLFGKPQSASYTPNLWSNGIDTSGCLTLRYPGFVSSNVGAKDTWGVNYFQIEGEQGYIYVAGGSNVLDTVRVVTRNSDDLYNAQFIEDRWAYEVENVTALLLAEDHTVIRQRLKTAIATVEVLEQARLHAGIRFPCDAESIVE